MNFCFNFFNQIPIISYPDDLSVLSFHGQVERRLQVDVLQIEACTTLSNQQFGHFDVIVERGQMEGRVAVVLLLVDDPRTRQFR